MTIEDKELLLADLSARLPYGVKVQTPVMNDEITLTCGDISAYFFNPDNKLFLKPYLRSMSSMTEEEMKKYHSLIEEQRNMPYFAFCSCVTRYLDSIHVDHRAIKDKDGKWKTMIQLGLALEAPEGMYK